MTLIDFDRALLKSEIEAGGDAATWEAACLREIGAVRALLGI